MSLNNFLSFLQQLITMADPSDPASVALAKQAVVSVVDLARLSQKTDSFTWRIMVTAATEFDMLLRHKSSFAGKPGDLVGNKNKRDRMLDALYPGC